MKNLSVPRRRRSEAGVALLIAIFVLLLIGVTAIALIISSGMESALAGNYRSSASAYYAALAGLEEARGRLLPSNPDNLAASMPPPGTPLAPGQVIYILNRLPGETVNPTDLSNPATYPDTEYQKEFPSTPITSMQPVNSVSAVPGLPGPLYKWVRINAVTEKSLNLDVNSDGFQNPSTPLFFDPSNIDLATHNPKPSLIVNTAPPSSAVQALEITALAALPNGTQKLLQYVVTPSAPNLNFGGSGFSNPSFPAALTLDGNNVQFTGANFPIFNVNGNDHVGPCPPGSAANPVSAIAYTNGGDLSNIHLFPAPSNYSGASPNVTNFTLPADLQKPSGLDALVQNITQSADAVITPTPPSPATQSSLPSTMSSSNPMTIVVNGDLNLTNWGGTGYGLLVVTGRFTYDPSGSWKGIILVIGQGEFVSTQDGNGEIDGAVLVAKTRDASGNLLPDPNLGAATFSQIGGGLGIYYSKCWINAAAGAQKAATYRVLSYRQLPQL